MSQLFARVFKQALATFDRKNLPIFETNFNTLTQLVEQLCARDINLDMNLTTEEAFRRPDKGPCTVVDIFGNDDVAMSVFILRGDYTMPLHDHPVMHGIVKSLSGSLLVQSYTRRTSPTDTDKFYVKGAKEIQVIAEDPRIYTSSSKCAVLTPLERNYHEISAIDGVAAFFDILSPPYDCNMPVYGRRSCNFYRKLKNGKFFSAVAAAGEELTLEVISTPLNYYGETGYYNPPDFLLEHFKKYDLPEIT